MRENLALLSHLELLLETKRAVIVESVAYAPMQLHRKVYEANSDDTSLIWTLLLK